MGALEKMPKGQRREDMKEAKEARNEDWHAKGCVLTSRSKMDWKALAPQETHDRAAADLLDRYGIRPVRAKEELLNELALVFAAFPYENITKLIRKHTFPPGPGRFRLPVDVASDHLHHGAGGTCFSLSTLFGRVMGMLGIESYPVLAAMRSVRTLHTGLVVPAGRHRFLMDPGYLIHRPMRMIPGAVFRCETSAGVVELAGQPDGQTYELYTDGVWRYRFEDLPLPKERFLELWIDSFDWVMMNQLHLSRRLPDGYCYAHGHRLRTVQDGQKHNRNMRSNQAEAIESLFGLSASLAEKALGLLAEAREKPR